MILYTQYKHVLVVFFAAARIEVTKVRAMPFWLFMISGQGPRWGRGWGAAPHFLKKKESLMEKEYSTGGPRRSIQNLWLVRFDPISQGEHKREWGTLFSRGKPQNDYLFKTALSRRLLRFHQPGDVVYAQTMESFLSRFL